MICFYKLVTNPVPPPNVMIDDLEAVATNMDTKHHQTLHMGCKHWIVSDKFVYRVFYNF